jgi:hypothetical protein
VTSRRQRVANRANSGKSTGPRTKAGKSASKLNARLHGLAAAVQSERGADAEIERLARAIADEAGRPDLIELARRIAEAELDLRRIRRARATLMRLPAALSTSFRMAPSPNSKLLFTALRLENRRKESSIDDLVGRMRSLGWTAGAPELVEEPLKPGAKRNIKLDALERYERRATSRRKSAIRQFDNLSRSEKPTSPSGSA